MKQFNLKRIIENDYGTFGVLLDGKVPFAVTLEQPWRNNQKNLSCIPMGWYTIERIESPKFGKTFEVRNVEGRSHILFHKGNIVEDTSGCILLGESFDPVLGTNGIVNSGKAFREFMDRLEDEQFATLLIY